MYLIELFADFECQKGYSFIKKRKKKKKKTFYKENCFSLSGQKIFAKNILKNTNKCLIIYK